MLRKIVRIDQDKCNGCGLCIGGCHEGALQLIDGKAKLLAESYCDGLGACLPDCPTGAITIMEREAESYDEAAVQDHNTLSSQQSELRQWPCQLQLVPVNAPYFAQAHLLIAADCAAYACADMHTKFMRNKITLIGCPKLDAINYAEKLAEILKLNEIKSIAVVRMEVPCCGGLVNAVKEAIIKSGKMISWSVAIIGTDGNLRED